MLILVPIAFAAGVITAFTPCILPVLPIVLAGGEQRHAAQAVRDRRRPRHDVHGVPARRRLAVEPDRSRREAPAQDRRGPAARARPLACRPEGRRARRAPVPLPDAPARRRPRRRLPARSEPRARVRSVRRACARDDRGECRHRPSRRLDRRWSRSRTRSAQRCRCSLIARGSGRLVARLPPTRAGGPGRRRRADGRRRCRDLQRLGGEPPDEGAAVDAVGSRIASRAARPRTTGSTSCGTTSTAPRLSLASRPAKVPLERLRRSAGLPRRLRLAQHAAAQPAMRYAARSCSSTSGRTRASTACARSRTSEGWDERYRSKGLVIVGVHTPEFAVRARPRERARGA